MRSWFRRIAAPVALLAALAPLAVAAAGMSVTVPRAVLHARIEVSLRLWVDCPAPASGDSVLYDSWDVSIEQAAGNGTAFASNADVAEAPAPLPFQCTSSNVAFPLDLIAGVTGRPFHNGKAVVSVLLYVGYMSGETLSATFGPAVVGLTG